MKLPFHLSTSVVFFSAVCIMKIEVLEIFQDEEVSTHSLGCCITLPKLMWNACVKELYNKILNCLELIRL